MKPPENCLWSDVAALTPPTDRFLSDRNGRVLLHDLGSASVLASGLDIYRGKSVLLLMARQIFCALAMIDLDGLAARLILCPPGLTPAQLDDVIADTQPDIILTDMPETPEIAGLPISFCGSALHAIDGRPAPERSSQWLLFTSGTTGRPKAVVHGLASLTAPLRGSAQFPNAVWSTFYDIRRYGGLTILLRALLGGGSMIFSEAGEPIADFLLRAGADGVTHISGTPSHWRQALMSGVAEKFRPAYVRLSGEPADQAILDALQAGFPTAQVSHAFASTEAGVAFDVRDGRAGFPESILEQRGNGVELKIENDTLRIRSARTAANYLRGDLQLQGQDGFVDTGDIVALRDGRYHFIGRREGIINVGGQKVHPEEVEAVINLHSAVQMSLVRPRRSPITGALVVADVVIRPDRLTEGASFEAIRDEIFAQCRAALPAHKVPAQIRQVVSLNLAPSGKLLRSNA
jgi:acyl-CoA synthetase (AMP-forming)/AMP-acid ligase II